MSLLYLKYSSSTNDKAMTTEPTARRPGGGKLWANIAKSLRDDVQSRQLKVGDRIPTEEVLAKRFNVNRHTVRRAIAELSEEGVLRAEQGRGTFVSSGLINYTITSRTRFSDSIRKHDQAPEGRLLEHSVIAAPARIAEMLAMAPDAPLIALEVLRHADGLPFSVTTHLFPQARFPDIVAFFEQTNSVTKALVQCGVADYTRGLTTVSARLPNPIETQLLVMTKARPVLVTESVDLGLDGEPIAYGHARFPADRVQLEFEP